MENSFIFDQVTPFKNDYACVRIGDKWGIIERNGYWVIKSKYDYLSAIAQDLFIVRNDNKYGVMDITENIIIPSEFDLLKSFRYMTYDNYLIAIKNNKYGIINLKGESVVPFEYEYISSGSTLYFEVVKDGKFGAIDISNNVIVPFEYDSELIFGKDFVICGKYKCIVENDEVQSYVLYGITDYIGNNLIPFEYKELKPFGEDKNIAEYPLSDLTFSAKKQNDKYIIINGDNKQICEQEFESITPESIKVYSARINGKDCAIDKFGNIKIQTGKYKNIYGFIDINENECVAIAVNENNEEALINQNGEIIVPFEAEYKTNGFMYTRQNTILMQKNNKFGVIDNDNNTIIPFIYDWIYYEGKEKYSGANIGDKWGYIDGNGTPLYIKTKDEVDNGQLKLV